MLNQVILVGRLKDITNSGILILNVSSITKNEKGEYYNYPIEIKLTDMLLQNVKEYCNKGDTIGIRGQVIENNIILAEKLSFLGSHKHKKEEE